MRIIVLCFPVEDLRHIARIAAVAPEAEIVDAGQDRPSPMRFSRPISIVDTLRADLCLGTKSWPKVDCNGFRSSAPPESITALTPAVVDSNIVVTSASGVLADQVAEQTMALMAGLARSLPVFFRAQQAHEFIRRPTRDIHGTTIGIVGFGGNGRRLAEVLRTFKTRILATDVFPVDKPDYIEALWPAERLDDLLRQSDYVILAALAHQR